ncbi:probable C-mannosyltransferase DPY19L3 [Protopterus annectens]|uniref:probable C-mannosyltransferase DPY19L3 n=1 Tax=Protopterus annectens TaxID=7888 RepID=UPI001CF968EE|nr:probable C-mannosyltransferase DPY19L3 [Protopterus annectens]XP_043937615.1 probable C-mannosyltransferase DPY19L3 [Protopterus annectens]
MENLRQRKGAKIADGTTKCLSNEVQKEQKGKVPASKTSAELVLGHFSWNILSNTLGGSLAVSFGLLTSVYVATLHENDLWFSNIKEVEREISFRTECGLYYSYYKQMVQAPSIQQGLYELMYDNKTESRTTINILRRMNVYQEVIVSILYRILPVQKYLEAIYFYTYTVFGLQTLYVFALFVNSWLLSGTWLSGVLAATWYILNRIDTTRVEFTIPLRENWSLPFFALQVTLVTYFLKPQKKPYALRSTTVLVFLSTFVFSVTWQFNQFILLVQALALFGLDSLDMVPSSKVTLLYMIQVASLLLVWVLQFFNSMILGSLVLSFILAAMLTKHLQRNLKVGSLTVRMGKLLLNLILVLCLTYLLNYFIKKQLLLESDEHIFKFIKAKSGFGATRDFDASLYVCEEAFGFLPFDTFKRLSHTLLLFPYALIVFFLAIVAVVVAYNNISGLSKSLSAVEEEESTASLRPEIAYNLVHTILFGLLAITTMRMKYLWIPHMCVVASFGVCSKQLWRWLLGLFHLYSPQRVSAVRHVVPVLLLLYLSFKLYPLVMEELSELREFYDPDTVDLMNWIRSSTPKNAVFAGSMQLLAGVKLCTGRTVTNHPHYEDKALRERTKQVYQIYAKQPPENVHSILRTFGADYVILEDSICYERRHNRGCRLRDLLDVTNGHVMDGPGLDDPDLVPSAHPRFCDAIRKDEPPYTSFFSRVFKNKTFHVYKLKKQEK